MFQKFTNHTTASQFFILLEQVKQMKDDDEFDMAALKARKAQKDREAALRAAAQDPEVARILEESRQVQQETVSSSRNAARTIKETVVVAEKTSSNLKQQGEQLQRIEETAEQADMHADDAYKSARDLHKYKGFLPFSVKSFFTGGRKKAQDSELASINKKLDKQTKKITKEDEEKQRRKEAKGKEPENPRESILSDSAEREINANLDDISSGLETLRQHGTEMQREISQQRVTMGKIEARTEHTEYTLDSANRKIREFL